MNTQEIYSLMVDLKVAPATIYGLIDDYNKLGADSSLADRTAYALKVYKAAEPLLQSIPGWGKVSTSAAVAWSDYNTLSAKIDDNTAKTSDYLTLVSSSTNLFSDIVSISKTPQGQGAGLLLKLVSGGFSYGAVFTSGDEGGALEWQSELVKIYINGDEESRQTIKNFFAAYTEIDNSPVTNAINVTTTTTIPTPTQPGATGENAAADYISQGFIYKGISVAIGTNDINGLNYGTSITDSIPYSIVSGGIRPGNMNITSDYSLMLGYLADNVSYFYTHPIGMGTSVNNFGNQTYYPVDPLVLDLNGDGVKLTDYASNPVLFDADHDGKLEQTGWVSKEDGMVVVDRNANGKIDDMSETLSEYYGGQAGTNGNSGTKPYKNGFDALKSLDSNRDGVFNARNRKGDRNLSFIHVRQIPVPFSVRN